jgi:hypothetical protein
MLVEIIWGWLLLLVTIVILLLIIVCVEVCGDLLELTASIFIINRLHDFLLLMNLILKAPKWVIWID